MKSIGNLEQHHYFNFLKTISSTSVQPSQGSAMVQDAQFISQLHGYPKPDSNKIYTHHPDSNMKSNIKKGVSHVPWSFQAYVLLSQKKKTEKLNNFGF